MCHLDFSWRKPAFVPEVSGWGQAGAREGQGGAAAREGTCLHPSPQAPRTPGRGTSDFSGRQGRTTLSRAATTAKLWQPRDLPRCPRPDLTYRSPPLPSAAAPWPDTLSGTAAAETERTPTASPARPPGPAPERWACAATPRSRPRAAARARRGPKRAATPSTQRPGHALSMATPLGSRTPTQPRPQSSKVPPPSTAWDRTRSWSRLRAPPRWAPAPQTPKPR